MLFNKRYIDAGFTFIEVLVALFIFTVGLLALAKVQVLAIKINNQTLTQSQDNLAASNAAEQLPHGCAKRIFTH